MEIKNWVLGIAIMILTIFVAVYGLSVIYPKVNYEDYCPPIKTAEVLDTQEKCEIAGGQWTPYAERIPDGAAGYCDRYYECSKDYEDELESRSKKIFYFSIPLGILILFIGGVLFSLEAVGAGLMGGGIGIIVYGAGGYWRYGDDLFRFIISLLGLAAVIYLAYWFNNRTKKKKKSIFQKKKKRISC